MATCYIPLELLSNDAEPLKSVLGIETSKLGPLLGMSGNEAPTSGVEVPKEKEPDVTSLSGTPTLPLPASNADDSAVKYAPGC